MDDTITIRTEGVTLDALLAARYDPATGRALVPAALALNPGLAQLGPVLPLGTTIVIPPRPAQAETAEAVTTLFG